MASTSAGEPAPIISTTTVSALSAVASILVAAYTLSRVLLPEKAATKTRLLFVWHMFDAIVHFTLEGSFLYSCFFHWAPIPKYSELETMANFSLPMTPPGVYFLANPARLYGAFYSNGTMARLWQEYARADRRWGGADLTLISLELLTVFVMGPLSVYVCYHLVNGNSAKAWFWMSVVATGELYGGFMTFAPEWLTGSPNLDTSNFMLLWIYLVFFNAGLWVVIPCWVLWEAYNAIQIAFASAAGDIKILRSEPHKTCQSEGHLSTKRKATRGYYDVAL